MAEETVIQEQENPIYKFLRENNLTTKDEATFTKDYANPEKQKELHKFMRDNQLTTKDFDTFSSDNFGAFKKYTQSKSLAERFTEWIRNIYKAITTFPSRDRF